MIGPNPNSNSPPRIAEYQSRSSLGMKDSTMVDTSVTAMKAAKVTASRLFCAGLYVGKVNDRYSLQVMSVLTVKRSPGSAAYKVSCPTQTTAN